MVFFQAGCQSYPRGYVWAEDNVITWDQITNISKQKTISERHCWDLTRSTADPFGRLNALKWALGEEEELLLDTEFHAIKLSICLPKLMLILPYACYGFTQRIWPANLKAVALLKLYEVSGFSKHLKKPLFWSFPQHRNLQLLRYLKLPVRWMTVT